MHRHKFPNIGKYIKVKPYFSIYPSDINSGLFANQHDFILFFSKASNFELITKNCNEVVTQIQKNKIVIFIVDF